MADLLLHQRFRAADTAQATAAVQAVFGVGTITTAAGTSVEYVQQSLVDDGVSATRIECSGEGVRVLARAAPDLVIFTVRDGGLRLLENGEEILFETGEIGVVCLGSAVELRWDRVALDLFSFPPSSVGRLLGTDAHQLRLHCARLKARSAPVTRLWHRVAGSLWGVVLQERELFESDIIREQAIDALLAVSIEAFGISEASEDDELSDDQVFNKADRFMAAHLGDPITIPDVARAAGVSVRGLQLIFRRRGEGTPLLHLRGMRMEAARNLLGQRDRSTRPTSVGAVARQLSYTNQGRFSAHYREAFGERPGDTLHAASGESEDVP